MLGVAIAKKFEIEILNKLLKIKNKDMKYVQKCFYLTIRRKKD